MEQFLSDSNANQYFVSQSILLKVDLNLQIREFLFDVLRGKKIYLLALFLVPLESMLYYLSFMGVENLIRYSKKYIRKGNILLNIEGAQKI